MTLPIDDYAPTREQVIAARARPGLRPVPPEGLLGAKRIWSQLCKQLPYCPWCGYAVAQASFPWRFQRHDVHGLLTTQNAPGALCLGSRNVFTLDFLDIGSLL